MNYIKEIKAFYDLVQLKQLSTGQIALWHALMHINNKCAWIEWFTVPNLTLELTSGLSRKGIYNARNTLKQHGIIDFKTNGTKATSYNLISLLYITQDTTQDTTQGTTQGTTQDSATLNKRNETKLNNNNLELQNDSNDDFEFKNDSTEIELARFMIKEILKVKPDSKVPKNDEKSLQSWAQQIDYLLRLDNRNAREIAELFRWAQEDSFWCANIRSPRKLREKWDTLVLQKNNKDKNSNQDKTKQFKTRFHNLESRTDKYSADELNAKVDQISVRKRREFAERMRESEDNY